MIWFLLNVLPMIATIQLIYAYLPQIHKSYITKDVTGIASGFWWNISIALLLMTINALTQFIVYGNFGYLITEVVNLTLAGTMLILVLKYRKKECD